MLHKNARLSQSETILLTTVIHKVQIYIYLNKLFQRHLLHILCVSVDYSKNEKNVKMPPQGDFAFNELKGNMCSKVVS